LRSRETPPFLNLLGDGLLLALGSGDGTLSSSTGAEMVAVSLISLCLRVVLFDFALYGLIVGSFNSAKSERGLTS
jgi:hypothetical protein